MQANAHYLLVGLVALVALITVLVTLRVRHHKKHHHVPDLGEVEDILMPKDNSRNDNFTISPMSTPEQYSKSFSSHPQEESALAELGFGNMDAMFTTKDQKKPEAPKQLQSAEEEDARNSDLIIIHIIAQEGQQFIGYDLLQALLAAGLRYGDMSIFHRYQEAHFGGKIIFSLASATEPGIFDMNKMGGFSCKGLSLFMQLRAAYHNTAALELFLMTAEQLAEDLDGILQDGKMINLSPETVARYHTQVERHLARLKKPSEHLYSHR